MKINVNNSCSVKLTKRGAEILNEHLEDMPTLVTEKRKEYSEGDRYETEWWVILRVFGPHMYCGCDIPFVDNEIEILEWKKE